ncbi:sn-glycerol-3-phosphate ABC transporter substrate-binding protein UgpB [Pectobacterium wasabiae]|uniref:sn-glycerol-3-phosphate-binding periplasmic protein UgpB n=1 Tax=Pectobacterium wasabiae TaxID=55208 RepID=A0AAW3EBY8_9GAMM|nr:sn-glycerol-3-phosphate ABC transporter substrate-binding protein UgpB [Pectobacterium wasabiae]AOR62984.1 sn-glycerol-3-phosphate ABC transporter substrate-binding protein [Pectobacterium wasabiae CFBP 3304]EJS92257.1 Glycerol-3-phosphate ABC transporter [Pectobacterium wasabiae CFBP 3304]EJS92325.1 Glycerol-3-phosphate ABC transporter, periplasmic glycerol-3-phosphate binding protein [Pectobacterium wasabiae CFBP 3304]KFX03005.1 glycerol-3-phosphate ABC transporter substrate-binding protei
MFNNTIRKTHAIRTAAACVAFALMSAGAQAATDISFWHSMEGELGKEVNSLADRFNKEHTDVKIVPVYKGNYEQNLAAGIAAYRAGNAPAILQVYEVGTATMMASKAIKPVYDVFKDAGINFDESVFVPTVSGYYTDAKSGHLLSQPFNSSTPVLYYNKDAFKKAGLDPEQPPKTWQQMADYTAKLRAAGMKCGYASGWQGWIQIENFSAWNGLPVATKNNGFDGTDAVLEFNKPTQVKHIQLLQDMNKKGDFTYFGRKDEPTEKFYNGECAMTTASSGSLANIREHAKFNYGVGMMPYDADAKGAPQNAIIGGASLWVMGGKDAATYKGVAEFMQFLAKPENAAEWHQKTGYLPITTAAYELTQKQGFYEKNPGADIATRQMLNKPPLSFTKGLRLGNMPQIRTVVDEELESVWTGKKTPQQALDSAVERGNALLRRFEQSTK